MIRAKGGPGIRFNEHMEGDGEVVLRHACKLRLEGIASKRKDSRYRSGRSRPLALYFHVVPGMQVEVAAAVNHAVAAGRNGLQDLV